LAIFTFLDIEYLAIIQLESLQSHNCNWDQKEVECVTNVVAGGNESFESLLRRFTRKVQQDGILSEVRHREYFEKKSIKRKRKAAAKRRKSTRVAKKRI
jgi:small subunit ribosomal protein S21